MVLDVHHLVGSQEIGTMLGVSRQRVQQLINRADFPKPEVELAMGKVWDRNAIAEWARANNRAIAAEDSE
jgi:predicted DNA-binding transcriptional regulator AlpA